MNNVDNIVTHWICFSFNRREKLRPEERTSLLNIDEMRRTCQFFVSLLIATSLVLRVNAQTHYGSGAGTQGTAHSFFGFNAGAANTGLGNTFIGHQTGAANTTAQLNTFVGYSTGEFSNLGDNNTFVGAFSGIQNAGTDNTFLGFNAGFGNMAGQKNTYLGANTDGNPNLMNATAVGADTKVKTSNSLILGNNANVGIGTAAPVYQLHLSTAKAAKLGSPDWTVISDARLKKDVSDFTEGLAVLQQIRPVWFRYNGKADLRSEEKFVGIIAQEMQKIAPYTIGTFTHQDSLGNKTEYLDYDANAVTYILINSVKEQQQVIEQKNAELKEMNAQVADLSKRLELLERIIASNTAKPLNSGAARVEPNANGVVLEQNAPNGFSGNSTINYFIPESVKEARVDVYAVSGMKVNSYPVKERGEGRLTILAGDFQNGVFLYDLVTDGKSNGVKKMVVQK